MQNNSLFKVGNKIIDYGQVYKIFKIKKEKNIDGEKETVIFYKPYFEGKEKTVVCSIPVKNIDKAKIREPILKEELEKILNSLSKTPDIIDRVNTTQLREELNLNNLQKTAQVLKILWIDKNDETTSFTRWKQEVFNMAMERLIEEVALVCDLSLSQAREKIEQAFLKS